MDAVREALYRAEQDLSVARELKRTEPGWVSPEGKTIHDLVAERIQRVQDLKRDLHGDC